ncbi:hypothetical protein [Microbispora sitophila]|uniref:hypothetical protein n=1 Tax=Microbispora sitophila TaxID=2771537 RepID=UPI001D002D6E|nr:hypothetical protein [Microbispora sitophila]
MNGKIARLLMRRKVMRYRVTGRKGAFVVVTPDREGLIVGPREERADRLAERLGVPECDLMGLIYECDVKPDKWGVTFSDYRLVEP